MKGRARFAIEEKKYEEEGVNEAGDEQDPAIRVEVALDVIQCANSCADASHHADQSEATIQPLDQWRDYNSTKVERCANNQVAHDRNTHNEMNAANCIQGICYWSAKGSGFSKWHCQGGLIKLRYRTGYVNAAGGRTEVATWF